MLIIVNERWQVGSAGHGGQAARRSPFCGQSFRQKLLPLGTTTRVARSVMPLSYLRLVPWLS